MREKRDGHMPENYFVRYLPLLIHVVIVSGIAFAMVIMSDMMGPHRPNRAKLEPYECGMRPVGDAQKRVSVKFYLVAMLFILFDVELRRLESELAEDLRTCTRVSPDYRNAVVAGGSSI